jgi:hypothetical protein
MRDVIFQTKNGNILQNGWAHILTAFERNKIMLRFMNVMGTGPATRAL